MLDALAVAARGDLRLPARRMRRLRRRCGRLHGAIDHRDVFFNEQQKHENHKICACVSRAIGIVTIDTLYRPEAA